jgi:hypothetical protein
MTTTMDITELIQKASKQLNYQTPYMSISDFNLYDSMSALDIMDPKMDGCEVPLSYYIPNTNDVNDTNDINDTNHLLKKKHMTKILIDTRRVPPRPLPKSLHDTIAPLIWDELDLSCTKMILMEILVRLESFLKGNSVAETIYTCLYVHEDILQDMFHQVVTKNTQPVITTKTATTFSATTTTTTTTTNTNNNATTTTNATMTTTAQQCVFFASMVLVQLTDLIMYIVQKADIYEEEDFTMNRFQFRFTSDILGPSSHTNNSDDNDDEQFIQTWYHTCCESLNLCKSSDAHVKDIEHILQYMFDFYMACKELSSMNKDNVAAMSVKWYHCITTASSCLQDITTTTTTITTTTTTTTSATIDVRSCFDIYANRHRLGNTPIRQVIFKPYKEALQSLDGIYKELATSVCHLLMRGDTLKRSQRILSRLSKSSSLNITSRSLMVMNLFLDDLLFGQYNLALLIIEDMKRFGIPNQVMQTKYGIQFVQQLCKPTYDALKLFILNRNRQTIFMDALIFKEWSTLQSDATIVDATFKQEYDLGSHAEPFVMKYMVAKMAGFMEHYLSLGIELNMFPSHHPLMTVYWYLDFLQSTELSMTTSMKKQYEERRLMELKIMQEEADAVATTTTTTAASSGGKKGNKKKGKKNKSSTKPSSSLLLPSIPKTPEDLEDDFHLVYLNIKHMMYRGIFRVSMIITLPCLSDMVFLCNRAYNTHNNSFHVPIHIMIYT